MSTARSFLLLTFCSMAFLRWTTADGGGGATQVKGDGDRSSSSEEEQKPWSPSPLSERVNGEEVIAPIAAAGAVRNCDVLRRTLEPLLDIDSSSSAFLDLPQHKTFVSDMEICNNRGLSCCTRHAEEKLRRAAVKTSHAALHSATSYFAQYLTDNHLHYQDQFLEMLRTAENDTRDLLKTFYKIDDKDWKNCLDEFSTDLSRFLQHQKGDVGESLTKFYNQLFPIVFQYVLNDPSVVDLDLTYKECLMEIRQDLTPQPFGDAPVKLSHALTESLRAARLFLRTLSLGAELMSVAAAFPFEKQCSHALTRLEYCSLCEGLDRARSCRAFCRNVMRGCLSGFVGLERSWDLVIGQLQLLGSSMRDFRDVEEVLAVFPVRLSESIMHSMETAHKYYDKVISTCGHPKTFESRNLSQFAQPSHHHLPSFPQKILSHRSSLHSKIEMMLRNVIASRGFLSKLPDALCNSDRFPIDNCWNGTAMGLYKRRMVANGLAAQVAENPEMTVHLSQNQVVTSLLKKLDHVHQLLSGVVGESEEMQSDMASYGHFEGSGSYHYRKNGGGDDFSDDEDINVGGDGSGSGSYEDHDQRPRPRHPSKHVPDNDDFAFAGTTTRRSMPYITKSHQQQQPPRSPSSGSRWSADCILVLHTSLVMYVLVAWSS